MKTEIVFILDNSGSMGRFTEDTIGGFNSFLEAQKQESGEATLTTVLFNSKHTVLHDGLNIQDVKPMTRNEYCAGGNTALLDALGDTINSIGKKLNDMDEDNRPANVLFMITTDGAENASVEYSKKQIKEMIEHQQEKYNWNFIFVGANIDSVSEAASLGMLGPVGLDGVRGSVGVNYDVNNTKSVYSGLSVAASSLRNTGFVDAEYEQKIGE